MTRLALALAIVLAALPAPGMAQTSPVTLADAGGRPIARLDAHRETVKVRDARDQPLGEIKIQKDRVKLADAGGVERWKVKRKDYGAEIENAGGQRLFRVRKNGGGAPPSRLSVSASRYSSFRMSSPTLYVDQAVRRPRPAS